MTHDLNVKIIFIHVKNVINKSILLLKYIKLNRIINFEKKNCYTTNIIEIYLIIEINWKKNSFIAIAEIIMTTAFILIYIIFNSINYEAVIKIVIVKNIIIYDISLTQQRLLIVTNIYLIIWKKKTLYMYWNRNECLSTWFSM